MNRRQSAGGSRGDGRTRLLDTAEELPDRHGIDGVSVRTVTKASGHRNSSAVNYHFGNREQLVAAVLQRRQVIVEERRSKLLDEMEQAGALDARAAVEAAVRPLADMLDCPEGRCYLRLLHQATNHPDYFRYTIADFAPSILRTGTAVMPMVEHLPPDRRQHRLRLGIGMALNALADQARLLDSSEPPRPVLDRDTFTMDLVDVIIAALRA